MIAGWIPRKLMTGFAVMTTLAIGGPAAPAETQNGIPFVPPPAEWHRSMSAEGHVVYKDERDLCRVVIYAIPQPVPEGEFRAWFDYISPFIWNDVKLAFGGSNEILTDVYVGIANDGSEILLRDHIFNTYTNQINLQILSARKNGSTVTFVALSAPPGVYCSSMATHTIDTVGGGYNVYHSSNIPGRGVKVDKNDDQVVLNDSFREECKKKCVGKWMLCNNAFRSSTLGASCDVQMTQCQLLCPRPNP